jgi:hypothetical protein
MNVVAGTTSRTASIGSVRVVSTTTADAPQSPRMYA